MSVTQWGVPASGRIVDLNSVVPDDDGEVDVADEEPCD